MTRSMDPEQYEHHVAAVLRHEGWETVVSRRGRDLGVDILATREDRRLAVQVKKYGESTTKITSGSPPTQAPRPTAARRARRVVVWRTRPR